LCITGIHDESEGFGYVKSLMYKIKIDGLGIVLPLSLPRLLPDLTVYMSNKAGAL
jgi:hypothetical protein